MTARVTGVGASSADRASGLPACGTPDEPADPEPRQRIAADVVIEDDSWNCLADAAALSDAAVGAVGRDALAAARLPSAPAEVVVVLSDDDTVLALNRQFRDQPKPTNVLSFPAASGTPAATLEGGAALGDVILAYGTVAREADEMGLPLAHHLQHLVVHGSLHLLGFDHLTEAEAADMEDIERRVLASLGVPDPYAGTEPVDVARPTDLR